MACIIKITFQHPKEDAVRLLKSKVEEQNGIFEGDINGGDFSVPTKLGWFVVHYDIDQDLITINVIKKPLLVSCSRIKDEIEKYLSEYDPSSDLYATSFFSLDQTSSLLEMNTYQHLIPQKEEKITKEAYVSLMKKILSALDVFDLKEADTETRVKKIILLIAGLFDTDPKDLYGNIELKGHLLYGSSEFSILQMRLDGLVKELKPGSSISSKETNDCKIVNDCIKLVRTKIA